MPGRNLNLLSLDGGGIRGLSSLYILQRIMVSIDPDDPPKPCDCFDIIGGTSTGGYVSLEVHSICRTDVKKPDRHHARSSRNEHRRMHRSLH